MENIQFFFVKLHFFAVLNFFPVQKLIFALFWNCKNWSLVKKKILEIDLFDYTKVIKRVFLWLWFHEFFFFFFLDFFKFSGLLWKRRSFFLLTIHECQKFRPRLRIISEFSQHTACNRLTCCFLYTSHNHTLKIIKYTKF